MGSVKCLSILRHADIVEVLRQFTAGSFRQLGSADELASAFLGEVAVARRTRVICRAHSAKLNMMHTFVADDSLG